MVDLGLRRFNHPLEVRPAVFDLIRSERRQVAAKLRAEGEAQYLTITSQADRMRDAILAQAEAEAERIRGQAEAEATRILNEAHSRDPRFFEFLRTLESYRSILDPKATIVLSSSSPLLKLLDRGPAVEPAPELPRNGAAAQPQPRSLEAARDQPMRRRLASSLIFADRAGPGPCRDRLPRGPARRASRGPPVRPAGPARWEPGLHWGLPLGSTASTACGPTWFGDSSWAPRNRMTGRSSPRRASS